MVINNRLIRQFFVAGSLALTVTIFATSDLYGNSIFLGDFENAACFSTTKATFIKDAYVACKLVPDSIRDSVGDDDLPIDVKPTPKYIVNRRKHKSGVTELKLENGIIVLLYPFKSPERRVSIHGSLLGGFNAYEAARDRANLMAVINVGGTKVLRGRKPEDVARIKKDRFAEVQKGLTPYQRTVTIETRAKDFRYALEVYWAGIMDYEIDKTRYDAYKGWIDQGRPKAVEQTFQDSIRLHMYGNNPKILEELSSGSGELDSEHIINMFSKGYWGYGGSVYVIAGDIDTATIDKNVEMYLANLPGTISEIPLIHDSTIRVVKGIVRKDFKIEGQTGTRSTFYFHGEMSPTLNDYENLNIGAVFLADQIKGLLGSAADSVSVVPVWGVGPVPSFAMQVSFVSRDFASAKRNDDSIVSLIKRIKSGSASEAGSAQGQAVEDARNKYMNMFKESSSNTIWWAQRLSLFSWFRWPYSSANDESVISNTKISDVIQILDRTIDLSNYGHFHLSGPVATGGNK